MNSRLMTSVEKEEEVIKLVQEYINATPARIVNFMDGGDEGWECGDEEQAEYLNNESAEEIADWIIAGLS